MFYTIQATWYNSEHFEEMVSMGIIALLYVLEKLLSLNI